MTKGTATTPQNPEEINKKLRDLLASLQAFKENIDTIVEANSDAVSTPTAVIDNTAPISKKARLRAKKEQETFDMLQKKRFELRDEMSTVLTRIGSTADKANGTPLVQNSTPHPPLPTLAVVGLLVGSIILFLSIIAAVFFDEELTRLLRREREVLTM